jgi:hypothetical protein
VQVLERGMQIVFERSVIVKSDNRELVVAKVFERCVELDRQIFIPIAATVRGRSKKLRLVFKWDKAIGDRKLSNVEEVWTPLEKGINRRLAGFQESFFESEKVVWRVTRALTQ